MQFIFRDGIRRQMDAFRSIRKFFKFLFLYSTGFFFLDGFNQVFSLDHLQCFNPDELQLVLCGNQWPSWTLEDLLAYIEPSHGFTRERF